MKKNNAIAIAVYCFFLAFISVFFISAGSVSALMNMFK